MLIFPPLPSWQAMHPLVIHFPIALLLVAPLFILIGAARKPEQRFPYLMAALILMVIGTLSTFVASSSGEAAGDIAESTPQAKATLEQHEELAEITEIAFSALTLIYASILFLPRLLKREPPRAIVTTLLAVFLVFYAGGAVSLVNTAHQGGRLVHELGVKAQPQPAAAVAESAERE